MVATVAAAAAAAAAVVAAAAPESEIVVTYIDVCFSLAVFVFSVDGLFWQSR